MKRTLGIVALCLGGILLAYHLSPKGTVSAIAASHHVVKRTAEITAAGVKGSVAEASKGSPAEANK